MGDNNNSHQISHEFRNLTSHEDWIGVSHPTTFTMFAFRDSYQWPALYTFVDQSQEGEIISHVEWQQQYRGDDSLKSTPRWPEKGYTIECFARHSYSWEEEEDCVRGNKERKSYRCRCRWESQTVPNYTYRRQCDEKRKKQADDPKVKDANRETKKDPKCADIQKRRQRCDTCQYWAFYAHPYDRRNWLSAGKKNDLVQTSEKKLKIGREMKNIRMRITRGGQRGGGFEWWRQDAICGLGFDNRFLYIKSHSKDASNRTMCLVDSNPHSILRRKVYTIPCYIAVKFNDTREIWRQQLQPNISRLVDMKDENSAMRLSVEGESNQPQLLPDVHLKDTNSWWPNKNNQQIIKSYTKDKCLIIQQTYKTLTCGQNVEVAEVGSKDPVFSNVPCGPAKSDDQRSQFQFKTNGDLKDMFLTQTFLEQNNILLKINISWKAVPKKQIIECQDDLLDQWYISAQFHNTRNTYDHTLDLLNRICKKITIRVLELDPILMACDFPNNGSEKCLIITKIVFETGLNELMLEDDCKLDNDQAQESRWYSEPADMERDNIYQRVNFEYNLNFSEWVKEYIAFHDTHIQLDTLWDSLRGIYTPFKFLDQKLDLEQCEDPNCMKETDPYSPPIKPMLTNIINVKNKFNTKVVNPQIGQGRDMPAMNCSVIKGRNPNAPNGQQWIKNECAIEPTKVYCRFDKEDKKVEGIMVTNDQQVLFSPISLQYNINKISDVLNTCVKTGLQFSSIRTYDDLSILSLLSLEYGYTYHKDRGILIGYDFTCETQGKCSGEQRSLDGITNINSILMKFSTDINKVFSPITGEEAVMFVGGQIKSVKLSESLIVGVPCSTINELDLNLIGCKVTLKDVNDFGKNTIVCNQDCSSTSYPVQGSSSVQHEDSSACRAMMHSTFQQNINGLYTANIIAVQGMVAAFPSVSGGGGIVSESRSEPGNGYSIVKPDEYVCSSERVGATSFMQMGERVEAVRLLDKIQKMLINKNVKDSNNNLSGNQIKNNYNDVDVDVDKQNLNTRFNEQNNQFSKINLQNLKSNQMNKILFNNNYDINSNKNNFNSSEKVYSAKNYKKLINNPIDSQKNLNIENKIDQDYNLKNSLKSNQKFLKNSRNNYRQILTNTQIPVEYKRKGLELQQPTKNGKILTYKGQSINQNIFSEQNLPKNNNLLNNQQNLSNFRFSQSKQEDTNGYKIKFEYESSKDVQQFNLKDEMEQDIEGTQLSNVLFWIQDGDQSKLYNNVNLKEITKGDLVEDYTIKTDAFKTKATNTNSFLDKDINDLDIHQKLIVKIRLDYTLLNGQAIQTIRSAKKSIKKYEAMVMSVTNEYFSYFTQISEDFAVDIRKGVSMPIPDTWQIINPGYSSEEMTKIIATKDPSAGLSPHGYGFSLESDPKVTSIEQANDFEDLISQGFILVTRQHKIFDGSFHFSFKAAIDTTITGAQFRQLDQFTHYGLKINLKNGTVTVFINTPSLFKILQNEPMTIELGFWQRVVILMSRYKIKFWILNESSVDYTAVPDGMDDEFRKTELQKEGGVLVQDPSLKDGKVGMFAAEASGLMFANIVLYADSCFSKPPIDDNYLLISPYSNRQIENFKPPSLDLKFKLHTYSGSLFSGSFVISDAPNKKYAIVNTKETFNMVLDKSAASLLQQKDKRFQCVDMCTIKTSVRFDGDAFGLAMIGFKFGNPFDQQQLVIHKHMPKLKRDNTEDPMSCKVRLGKFNERPGSLAFVKFPNIKNKWLKIQIKIVKNKISVIIDNNMIFQDFFESDPKTFMPVEDGINIKKGSVAFGINGVIAQFSDIKVSAIKPPKDLPPTPPASAEEEEEIEGEDDDPELSGGLDEDALKDKEVVLRTDCVAINKQDSRLGYCTQKFNGDDQCINKFNEQCCVFENQEKLNECIASVNDATVKEFKGLDYYSKCFDMNKFMKELRETNCKDCCMEKSDIQVDNNSQQSCVLKCIDDFKDNYECSEGMC